jgi:hypothetical protein
LETSGGTGLLCFQLGRYDSLRFPFDGGSIVRLLSLCLLAVSLLIVSIFARPLPAQSPIDPGQLPSRTSFYLLWHGTPAGEARKNNSLYAFWDDPDFAPARASFLATFLNDTTKSQGKPSPTREEMAQYVTLLDNPLVVGYVRGPETPASAKSANTKSAPVWNGGFFIYDRTGKEELLSKAVLRIRSADADIPKLTEVTVAGVSALKMVRKSSTNYWAESGKYAVSAQELPVFEELLTTLNAKPTGKTLSQSSAYQEAKPLLNGGVIEFFLPIPSSRELGSDMTSPASAQIKPFLNALKLDSLHSITGRISLDGTKTHIQAAILGDTAPGGLSDIFADGQATPTTLAYVSPDTVLYSESQINLPGICQTVQRVVAQLGGKSTPGDNFIESAAQTRLGMPLQDALSIVTGEMAWLQTGATLEDDQKVFLIGIHNKPDALKLARSLMGDRITSERNEGNATYLKISLHGGQGAAGVAQWDFYYLALTPNMLFASSKTATLRKYVALDTANTPPQVPQSISAARAQFPQKLGGFSYFDFQKVDWPALKTKWIAEAHKAAKNARTADAEKQSNKFSGWLTQLNPEVFPRHLHTVVGGSWKDSTGFHIDEWLD